MLRTRKQVAVRLKTVLQIPLKNMQLLKNVNARSRPSPSRITFINRILIEKLTYKLEYFSKLRIYNKNKIN